MPDSLMQNQATVFRAAALRGKEKAVFAIRIQSHRFVSPAEAVPQPFGQSPTLLLVLDDLSDRPGGMTGDDLGAGLRWDIQIPLRLSFIQDKLDCRKRDRDILPEAFYAVVSVGVQLRKGKLQAVFPAHDLDVIAAIGVELHCANLCLQ